MVNSNLNFSSSRPANFAHQCGSLRHLSAIGSDDSRAALPAKSVIGDATQSLIQAAGHFWHGSEHLPAVAFGRMEL
jgi:hypothetical protein